MRTFIDITGVCGPIVASIGIYLEFGIGFALIFAGLSATGISLIAAGNINASANTG